jgi:hypothetical protein
MLMYPGPTCTDHPFFEELGDAEINTRIHKVLAHGLDQNPGAGPVPLREGVDCTRVSPLEPARIWLFMQISVSKHTQVLVQGLGCARRAPRGLHCPRTR